jgi:protein-S-isoprenylcysteine O-methyltransferase Ste14
MFVRALVAFLAMPGLVAGLIPWLLVRAAVSRQGSFAPGLGLLALGLGLLLWCVRDFYVAGRGTLAPWSPPRRLVVVGLYRVVRNPMYVAVLMVVLGWSLAFTAALLAVYALALATAFHLRVVGHEEPWLRRQFGADWIAYAATVPRWLPRLPDLTRPHSDKS